MKLDPTKYAKVIINVKHRHFGPMTSVVMDDGRALLITKFLLQQDRSGDVELVIHLHPDSYEFIHTQAGEDEIDAAMAEHLEEKKRKKLETPLTF